MPQYPYKAAAEHKKVCSARRFQAIQCPCGTIGFMFCGKCGELLHVGRSKNASPEPCEHEVALSIDPDFKFEGWVFWSPSSPMHLKVVVRDIELVDEDDPNELVA